MVRFFVKKCTGSKKDDVMDNILKNIQLWAMRSPFFFALAFFATSSCLDIGIILAGRSGVKVVNTGLIDVVVQSLFALLVLKGMGWSGSAGFNGPPAWRNLHLLWMPALLALFYLLAASATPISGAGVILL